MEHFRNPKNVGKMKDYDGLGKAGNLRCGDIMYLYIKVGKNKKKEKIIKDISFETFGCTVAIANTSLLTTMVKGKTLKEAMKISKEDLLKELGEVPSIKVHCSILATDALAEAIYDYFKRNKEPIPKELEKEHERIKKAEKIIEKKHAELVKIEKKIHGKD